MSSYPPTPSFGLSLDMASRLPNDALNHLSRYQRQPTLRVNNSSLETVSAMPSAIRTVTAFHQNAELPSVGLRRVPDAPSDAPSHRFFSAKPLSDSSLPSVPFRSTASDQQKWPSRFPPHPGASSFQPDPRQPSLSLPNKPYLHPTAAAAKPPVVTSWGGDREEGELSEVDVMASPPSAGHNLNRASSSLTGLKQTTARHPQRGLNPRTAIHEVTTSNGPNGQSQEGWSPSHRRPEIFEPAQEIRNKAKDAILGMVPFNVGFEQYLAEGVRVETLTTLYKELGLELPHPVRLQPQSITSHYLGSNATGDDASLVVDGPITQDHGKGSTANTLFDKAEIVGSDMAVTGTKASSENPSQKRATLGPGTIGINLDRASDPVSASELSKPTKGVTGRVLPDLSKKVKAGEAQLERKDLILQKLAAKRGVNVHHSLRPSGPPSGKRSEPAVATGSGASEHAVVSLRSDAFTLPSSLSPLPNAVPIEGNKDIPSVDRSISAKRRTDTSTATSKTTDVLKETNSVESETPVVAENNKNTMRTPTLPPQVNTNIKNSQPSKQTLIAAQDTIHSSATTPGIPGLFMSPPSNPQLPNTAHTKSLPSSIPPHVWPASRKRPVAADFDSEPSLVGSFKRPFGHSRMEQSLVINVSEDESAEEEDDDLMDIEGNQFLVRPPQTSGVQEDHKRISIRDMPPLTDVPTSKKLHPSKRGAAQTSTPGTPPIDPKGKIIAQENLKRTEERIQLMQRKIAELEQRKASQARSRGQTPTGAASLPVRSKAIPQVDVTEGVVSTTAEALAPDATYQVRDDSGKAVAAESIEIEEARNVLRAKFEERVRRRTEIESGLLKTKAMVEREKTRLEEIKIEREKCEDSVQEALSTAQRLEGELRRLELDGSPSLDVGAQVESEMPYPNTDVTQAASATPLNCHEQTNVATVNDSLEVPTASTTQLPFEHFVNSSITTPTKDPTQSNGSTRVHSEMVAERLQDDANPTFGLQQTGLHIPTSAEVPLHRSPSEQPSTESCHSPNSHRMARCEPVIQESPIKSEAVLAGSASSSDTERILSPCRESAEKTFVTSTEGGDNREGTIAPLECSLLEDVNGKETGATNTSHVSDESDSYEPPEQMPPFTSENKTGNYSPGVPNTVRSTPQYSPTHMDAPATFPHESALLTSPAMLSSDAVATARETIDCLDSRVVADQSADDVQASRRGYFKPYVSPLREFRSYRYHPKYLEQVSEGFRSLTFSHKIDPTKALCTYEASGGVCNDDSCGGQHFRDMGLSDDHILVQIGSVKEGRTGEEEAQYMAGLKHTLQGLRAQKVKDISTVAAKIAAYRSDFLQDKSRILILDPPNTKNGRSSQPAGHLPQS